MSADVTGNTYHLALQPGTDLIAEFGGLHNFMNWNNNLLTDSGGFQMVSLLDLAEITEVGVKFRSPIDGTEMLLTPEQSIHVQNDIGSDIMMQVRLSLLSRLFNIPLLNTHLTFTYLYNILYMPCL